MRELLTFAGRTPRRRNFLPADRRRRRCVECLRNLVLVDNPFRGVVLAGETYRLPGGVVAVMHGSELLCAYCPTCAADLRYCRICGCTDRCACDPACEWVEPNLCSACRIERAA